MAADLPTADIGIFGGTGFYQFIDHATDVAVDTPYGVPSARVRVGDLAGRRVAFLARHGPDHELPPHRINYRANLWAMRRLGVRRVIGPCASGSLQPIVRPGEFVVCDQLVDRTWGRADTYFDGPGVNHISFADPYCAELGRSLIEAGPAADVHVWDHGTVVVVQGPRFSTRAESEWYRDAGWHVINMTQYPEAALARELGMCYANISLITDYDAGLEGVEGIEPVTMEIIFKVLNENVDRLCTLLLAAVPTIPEERSCGCGEALDPASLTP